MSKKRFTEGLESLFGDSAEETLQESSPLLSRTGKQEVLRKRGEDSGKRSSAKDFSSDLQAFLEDAFEESVEAQLEQRKTKRTPISGSARVKKRHSKPLSGLDALIRSTVDPGSIRLEQKAAKRVTLTFDPEKLERLKAIARRKRSYLRDIIDEIVAEYLDEYEARSEDK
ncbi:MAG: hypothetical protein KDD06_03600 [Phaeodactylibacter sp.]|nr:hypothetical protein [Phaeodactylibacter sp.]MCB9264932.1 hypothetical protein [Lewinellaceae bacterium]MCB9291036.1 hypothetical protein [Lewinellaceae bacterium]